MIDSPSLHWRRYPSRYRLEGTKCLTCGTVYFPPRQLCPKCRRKGRLVPITLSGEGEIVTYTKVHVAPEGFQKNVPYHLGIIKLKEGPHLLAEIKGSVAIGKKVKMIFRKLSEEGGLKQYGYKFEVVNDETQ